MNTLPQIVYFRNAFFCLLFIVVTYSSNAQVYLTTLSGPNESPPNASPGTGSVTVTINIFANTMRVQCSFSGLLGTVTAAHIHAPTTSPGTGTAGVATTTPTFTGFPSGVSSGSYDHTFDMTLTSSYNPAYVTANGGTAASAFAALTSALNNGTSYFNIHSSVFPGGEIRGFFYKASVITDHFRTKATGNWNAISTWESSSDNVSWHPATLPPDFNSNTISVLNTHTVTVTANVIVDQFIVNPGSSVLVNTGVILTVK